MREVLPTPLSPTNNTRQFSILLILSAGSDAGGGPDNGDGGGDGGGDVFTPLLSADDWANPPQANNNSSQPVDNQRDWPSSDGHLQLYNNPHQLILPENISLIMVIFKYFYFKICWVIIVRFYWLGA